jgi:nucleotidyltransferase substrate binding protein (TIGR01987 family)
MDPLTQRTITRFLHAIAALERAVELQELPDHAERDAVLLRFELAAELMPKVLRRILSERGADIALPKDVVRTARVSDLIDDMVAKTLLSVIDDRNRMVHDYSEEYAACLLRQA